MLVGTEADAMTLCVMLSHYAASMKEQPREGSVQFMMYAFYDAVMRTSIAVSQVLDHKRSTREAFDILIDYSERLQKQLEELDVSGGGEDTSPVD
jgi:hypothetical protein